MIDSSTNGERKMTSTRSVHSVSVNIYLGNPLVRDSQAFFGKNTIIGRSVMETSEYLGPQELILYRQALTYNSWVRRQLCGCAN
jgi:hypothetical protein